MKPKHKWLATVAASVMVATAATAGLGLARTGGGPQRALPRVCTQKPRHPVQISAAKLIIEYNSTDKDLGVHGAFDADGWSELCVFDPAGRPIAVYDPRNQLNRLTMAGVFFESREPPLSGFSFADLAAFPEGRYRIRAKSFDGRTLVGSAWFTHDVPGPPRITAPALAPDPEQPGAPVSREGLVIDWKPVTKTVAGDPVSITGYEVIVTKEYHDDPHGFSQPIYDVHVPPQVGALRVPKRFLEPHTVYELEVLALEKSGNQTIRVGFFTTE
jgi:hypothetical protein